MCHYPWPNGPLHPCGGPGLRPRLLLAFLAGVLVGVSLAAFYFRRLARDASHDTPSDAREVTTDKKE